MDQAAVDTETIPDSPFQEPEVNLRDLSSDPDFPGHLRDLPAAGDERRDVLKGRQDWLTAKAEQLSADLGVESVDPAKIAPDREVRKEYANEYGDIPSHSLGNVPVKGMLPNYKYALVWRDPKNTNAAHWVQDYEREGWEIVKGDMPEARDKMSHTSERWFTDCLLMRIPLERYEQVKSWELARRRSRETGIDTNLLEQAERHGMNVFNLETAPGVLQQVMQSRMSSRGVGAQMNQAAAKQLALRHLDRHIRAGTIHLPSGRR